MKLNKDMTIYYNDILGEMTFLDLIYYIEQLIKEENEFETIIRNILEFQKFDDETITSLLNKSSSQGLEFILEILKDSFQR